MVSLKKVLLKTVLITSALSASLFASQSPLSPNTLPGEKPVPGDSPVAICDIDQPQILTLDKVDLSPNPPVRGTNLTVSVIGHLSEVIEEGAYVEVDVRYGYIKLLTKTFDICEEIGEVDLHCPLQAGDYKLTKTVELPNEVPPGKYVVYTRAFTKDDKFISCITATVVFNVDSWKIIS